MTKKEKTVGKTTYKYTIEDFANWLIKKIQFKIEHNSKYADYRDYVRATCLLVDFEKECKNGK